MHTPLSRRTVLRGLGTAIALPWLEAMLPTRSVIGASEPAKAPVRMAFCYLPNGMHMPDWTPTQEGSDYELPSTLQPLADLKGKMNVLSGLALDGARAHKDGGGDHARSVAAFLTGAHPFKTDGANIKNDISVDQLAAERVGKATRFASLELGCEPSATAGNCDSGYSCAYSSNVSWRTPTSPVAKEVNPRVVFDRLFGNGDSSDEGKSQAKRNARNKSVLDFALDDAKRLQSRLGSADQRKLDEYLFGVREIERRLASADKLDQPEEGSPLFARPAGVPSDYANHLRVMFDLMVLAMQTDSTRIMTFMYTNDSSNRSYPVLDVREGHHDLSHHGRNQDKQAKISKINKYHMEQFAYFAKKLADTKEGEGSLLDNCMVMYGSGIADGDAHAHHDLPLVLLGGAGGKIKTGRHLKYAKDTPLTNLYCSMLANMGVQVEKFGDSTGHLEGLAG